MSTGIDNTTLTTNKQITLGWKQFVQLEHAILQGYLNAIQKESDIDNREILKIGLRIVVDITNFIYVNSGARSNREIKEEYDSLITKKSSEFSPVIGHYAELNKISSLKLFLKCIKLFLIINKRLKPNIFRKPRRVLLESFNYQSLEILKDSGLVIPFSAKLFFRRKTTKQASNNQKNLVELTERLVNSIQTEIKSVFPELEFSTQSCQELILNYFAEFADTYLSSKSRKVPNEMILGTHNKTFVRMLSSLILQKGGEVVSFAHGHTLQNKDDHKLWMDLILSTKYYEYNESLTEELSEYLKPRKDLVPFNLSLEHLNNSFQVNENVDGNFDPDKAQSILIVGNAFKNSGFSSVTAFEPEVQADIERSILKYFTDKGKKAFYKQHPGGVLKDRITPLYEEMDGVEIITAPFESVMHKFDLIVFYYTRTSTIKDALLSDRNILILDLGIEEFCPKSALSIKKRCKVESWPYPTAPIELN